MQWVLPTVKGRPGTAPSDRSNYVSPKLQSGLDFGVNQNGVHARTVVEKGELLVVFGGRVGTRAELDAFAKERKRYALQLEENLFLLPPEVLDAGGLR